MYRLLSTHILTLIDDSVISIERYIVLQLCCLVSSDPVFQQDDLCTTECLILGTSYIVTDRTARQ